MRSLKTFLAALPLLAAACLDPGSYDGSMSPDPKPDPDPGTVTELSGAITQSGTWSGTLRLVGDASIEAGVDIVIAEGARFEGADGKYLTVDGSLTVSGSAARPVAFQPLSGQNGWGGIVVPSGGSLVVSHATVKLPATFARCEAGALKCDLDHILAEDIGKLVDFYANGTLAYATLRMTGNGAVTVYDGADVLITDSVLDSSVHDIVIQAGGDLRVEYSRFSTEGPYVHCGLHTNRAGSLTVTNSIFEDNEYAIMLGNAPGAVITRNNFLSNNVYDIQDLGGNTNVDATNNYWGRGAPNYPGVDAGNPAPAPFSDVGPRAE